MKTMLLPLLPLLPPKNINTRDTFFFSGFFSGWPLLIPQRQEDTAGNDSARYGTANQTTCRHELTDNFTTQHEHFFKPDFWQSDSSLVPCAVWIDYQPARSPTKSCNLHRVIIPAHFFPAA